MTRIATLNMWNTQGPPERYRAVLPSFLREIGADIILLQEVGFDRPQRPQSVELARHLGLAFERYFFSGVWQGHEEGLSIISRYPLIEQYVRWLPSARDGMDRIICGATVETPMGEIDVFSTHLAFPLDAGTDRARQAAEVLEFIRLVNRDLRERPLLLGCDLNDVPSSGAVGVLTCGSSGLRDAMADWSAQERITYSRCNPYTREELGRDRCIDYLLVSEQVAVKSTSLFGLDAECKVAASDHFGIVAEIQAP